MSRTLICLIAFAAAAPAAAQTGESTPPTRAAIESGLEERFQELDTNGDGTLEASEIDAANNAAAQQTAAALSQRMEREFAQLDSDKNGQLSLAEFKAGAPQPKPTPSDATLEKMDSNGDGRISLSEFGGDMLTAFDRLDSNKDGRLSEQEQRAARR